jgi:hypothetical protein
MTDMDLLKEGKPSADKSYLQYASSQIDVNYIKQAYCKPSVAETKINA